MVKQKNKKINGKLIKLTAILSTNNQQEEKKEKIYYYFLKN
jgi:hypothetical protein